MVGIFRMWLILLLFVLDLSASPAEFNLCLQERSKLLNAERYAAIKETYAATLSDMGATLDEMVRPICQPLLAEGVVRAYRAAQAGNHMLHALHAL